MTILMSRLDYKHNMHFLATSSESDEPSSNLALTHLLQTKKCFTLQQMLQSKKSQSL